MKEELELKANMGLLIRGDIVELKRFADGLSALLAKIPSVQLVYKHISASKLWIKEGGDVE